MSFLTKNKYVKYSRQLDDVDYQFFNLLEQCKKDIAEIQFLPLGEHQQNRCKNILVDIMSRCRAERVELQEASHIVENVVKSLEKNPSGEVEVNLPVKKIIRQGNKHARELKIVHEDVLNRFAKENMRERVLNKKFYENDIERNI